MPKTEQTVVALDQMKILVIGPNCWGFGDTLNEALQNAKKAIGSRFKYYQAWFVHPDTHVSEVDGSMDYPKGYKPKKFHEVLPKKVKT